MHTFDPQACPCRAPNRALATLFESIVSSAVGQAVRGQCTGNLQMLSGNVVTHDVNMFVTMYSVRGLPTGLPRKYLLVHFTQIFARLETQCRCVSHILKPIYSYALGIAKKGHVNTHLSCRVNWSKRNPDCLLNSCREQCLNIGCGAL